MFHFTSNRERKAKIQRLNVKNKLIYIKTSIDKEEENTREKKTRFRHTRLFWLFKQNENLIEKRKTLKRHIIQKFKQL